MRNTYKPPLLRFCHHRRHRLLGTFFVPVLLRHFLIRIHVRLYLADDACRITSNNMKRRDVLHQSWPTLALLTGEREEPSILMVIPAHLKDTRTFVTTDPAPTVLPLPTVTPGRIVTFPPIQQSSPMWISLPVSGPLVPFRISGSSG